MNVSSNVCQILVVSEDPEHLDIFQEVLGLQYEVVGCAPSHVNTTLAVAGPRVKVVLLNLREGDSIKTLEDILALNPVGEVIVFSKEEDVKLAVAAIRAGAFHYLFEPLNHEVVEVLVSRALYKMDIIDKIRKMSLKNFLNTFDTERGLTLAKELADKRRREGKPIFHKELLALLPRPQHMSAQNMEKVMDNINEIQGKIPIEWETTRILVVEDDPFAGPGLVKTLKENYEEVILARSATEALATDLGSVDIILLDIFLPEKDLNGVVLLPMLKAKYPSAEVIVMTAFQISSIAVDVLKGGAWSYLGKPFHPTDLLVTVASTIQMSSLKKVLADLQLNVLPESLSLQSRIGLFQELYTRRNIAQEPTTYEELLLFSPELASRISNPNAQIPKNVDILAFIQQLGTRR